MSLKQHPYVRPSQVIESMRDNGYKNTAYALAELIDNSIQAGAKTVRFVCFEAYEKVNNTSRKRIQKIAILDDGYGMDEETLYMSLEFGASKNRQDPEGMGKFGMGLPNSSISQCKRTEVWSWKNSAKPFYTYLDVDEIKNGNQEVIPYPIARALDSKLSNAYKGSMPRSGTAVVWSELDRLHWKTSTTLLKHTENLIGRMYRYMLQDEKVRIVFENYLFNDSTQTYDSEGSVSFKANDPLYLMKETVVEDLKDFPSDFKGQSIFDIHHDGEKNKKFIELSDGTTGYYCIKSSSVKKSFTDKMQESVKRAVGSTDVGKHFASNIGLSIIRSGRELDLKRHFKVKDKYLKDRYIGVEVQFSPSLDRFFGVTNNKQTATKIQPISLEEIALQEDVDEAQVIEVLTERDPDYALLITCLTEIEAAFQVFDELDKKKISVSSAIKESTEKNSTNEADVKATDAEYARSNVNPTIGDDDKPNPEEIKEALSDKNFNKDELDELIQDVIQNEISVKFDERDGPQTMLFDISIIQGFTLIQINTEHNFYRNFLSKATERDKMLLKLCLAAWGRMEKEAPSENVRRRYEFARQQWGVMLDGYLSVEEDY
ncbi:ATP-binding protein [Psychrobacter sp. BI730]|uniref:ATP-binding protein n=1 Tax=Psychrobacter sp. BI730 TaxID=2705463 RepID=UPI0015C6D475|nr:ATP-binding protein [Psychrobacter sp. BI730]NYR10827.1 ATP-binding protein [Psychrobacter sp. BI730]